MEEREVCISFEGFDCNWLCLTIRPGVYEEAGRRWKPRAADGETAGIRTGEGLPCSGGVFGCGFGFSQNRWGLERVLKSAERGEFRKFLIEYPDRLARFGYAYLERHVKYCGVEIEVTSRKEPEDAHTELVQDLLAIVTSFSARLYGARGGRKIRQGFRELIRDAGEAKEGRI
jgi:hypothetical protein